LAFQHNNLNMLNTLIIEHLRANIAWQGLQCFFPEA
jgi:hypothetical protein